MGMTPCCPCWSYLTPRLCFWSESPLAPSSSSSDVPIVLILGFGTNTKFAHTKYLGFWRLPGDSGIQGFLVQYPEHIASTPVHILTLKTVFTASPKWSFWSHSVLTSLSISSLNSYLFTPFLSFVSESPVFPVSLHLAFSFLNKNDFWKKDPLPTQMSPLGKQLWLWILRINLQFTVDWVTYSEYLLNPGAKGVRGMGKVARKRGIKVNDRGGEYDVRAWYSCMETPS